MCVCFSPPGRHDDLDTPAQQQARISASCATRELDELMASLSDFKVTLGAWGRSRTRPCPVSVLTGFLSSSSSLHVCPQPASLGLCSSSSAPPFLALSPTPVPPVLSLPAGLVLHIHEDGLDQNPTHVPRSPVSSLSSPASDAELDSAHPPVSQGLVGHSPSPSNTVTTPSLTSVNTVLDHKSPSPSVDSPSSVSTPHLDLEPASSTPASPPPPSSSSVPPLPAFGSPSRSSPLPLMEPSLDEALDKLLAMSFAHNHASSPPREEVSCQEEVQEELILPVDRCSVRPDTFASTTITDESVDGNGDLDWADEELSMSFHEGLDGSLTPYTERPFTDGSVTPLTEASWMDESMTPSSCPGTPEAALDLPLLQTPTMDRLSASGHVRLPPPRLCGCHNKLDWFSNWRLDRLIYPQRCLK